MDQRNIFRYRRAYPRLNALASGVAELALTAPAIQAGDPFDYGHIVAAENQLEYRRVMEDFVTRDELEDAARRLYQIQAEQWNVNMFHDQDIIMPGWARERFEVLQGQRHQELLDTLAQLQRSIDAIQTSLDTIQNSQNRMQEQLKGFTEQVDRVIVTQDDMIHDLREYTRHYEQGHGAVEKS